MSHTVPFKWKCLPVPFDRKMPPTVYKTKPMVFALAVTHVLQSKCISTVHVVLSKNKGKNLLYFGCRHKAKDFLYRDELRKFLSKIRHTFLFMMIVRTIL